MANQKYPKSVGLTEESYEMLMQKQIQLASKRKKTIPMTQVVEELIEKGLSLVE